MRGTRRGCQIAKGGCYGAFQGFSITLEYSILATSKNYVPNKTCQEEIMTWHPNYHTDRKLWYSRNIQDGLQLYVYFLLYILGIFSVCFLHFRIMCWPALLHMKYKYDIQIHSIKLFFESIWNIYIFFINSMYDYSFSNKSLYEILILLTLWVLGGADWAPKNLTRHFWQGVDISMIYLDNYSLWNAKLHPGKSN